MSHSISSTSLLSGNLLPCINSLCITSCEIYSFLPALCRILRMVAYGARPTGNLLYQLISALTTCRLSSSLPALCLNSFSMRAYIFQRRRMSELILAIFLETKVTASFWSRFLMLGYLQYMISSTCWYEQGLKMVVSNLRRDWSLASNLRVKSMTLEMRTRINLAPTHSHSSMLYRNFWSLINWSIQSRIMILVSSLLPMPDFSLSCSACDGFFSFTPYSRDRMPQYTWLADHMLMQFRQATLTVLEFDEKKSITLVIRDVLPHPVFPCRHSGVVVPFSDIAMKSKIRWAYSFRPGTSFTTSSNRFLSQLDWKPNRSSLFSFGGFFSSLFSDFLSSLFSDFLSSLFSGFFSYLFSGFLSSLFSGFLSSLFSYFLSSFFSLFSSLLSSFFTSLFSSFPSSFLLIWCSISSSVYILRELKMASSAWGSRQPLVQRSMQTSVSASRLNSLSYAHFTQFGSFQDYIYIQSLSQMAQVKVGKCKQSYL